MDKEFEVVALLPMKGRSERVTGKNMRSFIEKARKVLGYEPKLKMKEGIKRAYDWITENRRKIELSLGSDATLI